MIKLEITTTDNGYVLETFSQNEEGKLELTSTKVFEEKETISDEDAEFLKTTNGDNIALGYLLYAVAESVGYQHDKYGYDNLAIHFAEEGSHAF